MKVVIIGNGGVGETLVEYICKEGHNVTVIDEEPQTVDAVVNRHDVLGIIGNGSSVHTQKEAGIDSADLVIAVTPSDELNIICCMIARRLGAAHSIARVRDPEYLNQNTFMCRELGIDMIVNPEYEAAREGAKLVRFPAAMKLDTLCAKASTRLFTAASVPAKRAESANSRLCICSSAKHGRLLPLSEPLTACFQQDNTALPNV